MIEKAEVGFDRRLKLEWLDSVVDSLSRGLPVKEIRERLARELQGQVAESGERGARSKTITVLCRIWCQDGSCVDGLRREALTLHKDLEGRQRVWLHAGLTFATYPFFLDAMETVGRILRLQGDVSLRAATRRMCERWGDRERVIRSVRHVIQSIRDWGFLDTTPHRGVYVPSIRLPQPSRAVGVWMVRALLVGMRREVVTLREVLLSPGLFPFELSIAPHELRESGKVTLYRQGLDTDLISLVG